MSWNPDQYLKFAEPRLRPAVDLLRQITIANPSTVVDLGCGTGNTTQLLAQRWPNARIIGVDNSPDMLARAQPQPHLQSESVGSHSNIQWQQHDLAVWLTTDPVDLIYSNAALHWLGEHDALFPRLLKQLAPGGTLAVQMPRNFDAPSHRMVADVAMQGPWRARLEHLVRPAPVAPPQFYYGLLSGLVADLDIWECEYLHVLEGNDAVKEWTKGSWLKPFLDALDEPWKSDFEHEYARRLRPHYPQSVNGRTLLPFRRLFMVARAPG